MPYIHRDLSAQEKEDILNPPVLRNAYWDTQTQWPKEQSVPGPLPNPTKSFWIEEFRHRLDHLRSTPELPANADIVIIGTGITGCSAAYHLTRSRPDLTVLICDARAFCSGATGRNGGHCFRPEGWGFRELVDRLGPQAAMAERRFFMKNRDMMQETLDLHGIRDAVDCKFDGGVQIFASEQERQDSIADLKLANELGLDHGSRVVDAAELSKIIQCYNEHGGLHTNKSGSFWPRKFCAEIMEQSMKQGQINVQTDTMVTSITPADARGMRWTISTTRGDINTTVVLHATNAWAGSLLPEIMGTELEVVPVRDQVIAARPSPSPNNRGTWPVNVLARYGYHWLTQMPQRPDEKRENCVVYGLHGMGPSVDDETLLSESEGPLDDYRRYLPFTFPDKFSVTDSKRSIPKESVEYAWTGIIGVTKDENVILGPVKGKKGQFTSVGYNGAGMVKCWGSGYVVADMILWEMGNAQVNESDVISSRQERWVAPSWYPRHYLKNLDEL